MTAILRTSARSVTLAIAITLASPLLLIAVHEFRTGALVVAVALVAVALWDQVRS
jgi:hypothetical protein